MNSLVKNKTWQLVEKPKDKKVLDLKWIYTNKSDNHKKARQLFEASNKRKHWKIYTLQWQKCKR